MPNSWKDNAGSPFDTYKHGATASRGMVSSNHPMASAAGLEMLAMGGNAIDAAIATAFALTVVEPMMIGIFGAGFINFYNGNTGEFVNIDNYAIAPKAATPDMFGTVSDEWPDYMETVDRANDVGYRAVGVPGALMGWCQAEEKYGRLGLDTVIQPAIRHAERGFPASQYLVDIIGTTQADLAKFPASAEIFLSGGSPPSIGDLIVRTDYARTLKSIAKDGPDVLYHGIIGEMVADDMASNGGIVTGDDLENYQIHERTPVRQTYREFEIVSTAPTSSGGTHIIQVLNLLEGFDVKGGGFGSAENIHLIAEALKISFADRFEYMGDPAFVEVPVDALISKEYADIRRQEIDLTHASNFKPGNPSAYVSESRDTTHLTVADNEGNVVSMTQTIHAAFGSKVTVPGTGMLLNNTMNIFDPHPGNANSIEPGKRMLSSMSPTIVLKDNKPFMALGTPGATRIFPSVLQAIMNVIDHGMTLQEAVEAPRVWSQGQALEVEGGISQGVRTGLEALGHDVQVVAKVAGGMNGIMYDQASGLIHGAACWRADGTPMGMSGGPARPSGANAMFIV
jgi:gamma-glutamyltranspeptidase/glutathione hydrolase